MEKKLETLYKLCEALMEELEDYSKKIEKVDGMSAGDLEAVDKLTHALKSVKTTIAMMESDEAGHSFRGNSNRYMPWYGGISYEGGQGGRSNARDGRGGMSSARRGRNQYSREGGYSYADEEFQKALEEALNAAPDERVREKLQRIMDNM